jgi:hypothetical protein
MPKSSSKHKTESVKTRNTLRKSVSFSPLNIKNKNKIVFKKTQPRWIFYISILHKFIFQQHISIHAILDQYLHDTRFPEFDYDTSEYKPREMPDRKKQKDMENISKTYFEFIDYIFDEVVQMPPGKDYRKIESFISIVVKDRRKLIPIIRGYDGNYSFDEGEINDHEIELRELSKQTEILLTDPFDKMKMDPQKLADSVEKGQYKGGNKKPKKHYKNKTMKKNKYLHSHYKI